MPKIISKFCWEYYESFAFAYEQVQSLDLRDKFTAKMKIIYKIAVFFHCLDLNNSLYY